MKTCRACGCYIPDLWGVCPGCGAIEAQKSDSVGRFAPDRYEVRGGRGNQTLIQFRDPEQPTPAWTYRSTDDLETCSLDSRTFIVTAEQAHLEPDAEIIWSSDPNVKPYPIELESYWPWSEIKLHQSTNK